jgi:hypothetical protein
MTDEPWEIAYMTPSQDTVWKLESTGEMWDANLVPIVDHADVGAECPRCGSSWAKLLGLAGGYRLCSACGATEIWRPTIPAGADPVWQPEWFRYQGQREPTLLIAGYTAEIDARLGTVRWLDPTDTWPF